MRFYHSTLPRMGQKVGKSMSSIPYIQKELEHTKNVLDVILNDQNLLNDISCAADICVAAINQGGKIMFAGNGGSAAQAQHLAAELVGKLTYDRIPLPGIALTTDTSILTAIANDYGYDNIFVRQIKMLEYSRLNNVLICLSTSGNSKNLIKAIKYAHTNNQTIALTGMGGGEIGKIANLTIEVPSQDTQKIQELHMVIGHIICGLIEWQIAPKQTT